MKRKHILITSGIAIIGITITWFFLTKEDDDCIYIGLGYGENGDHLQIEVNDELLHEETFDFSYMSDEVEVDNFMISRDNRYIMIDKYCSEDTIIKTRFIWNKMRDTTIYVN
ncbi:hypothetical protein [Xanthocytophaga flava]|uniref:hypothetical protein n=1 Tax=Xanthocytophaga flava TaxID=3048013 RepID=UPI0028D6A157|nr:hypothetical protein [Xanthocytophaga flavus]MDJ1470196.1 hypothetical protein [Xanthocytophaga flavus]